MNTEYMGTSSIDIELNSYWALLSPDQKKSLLDIIKSFVQSPETKSLQFQEPERSYNAGNKGLFLEILQQLSWEQKEALISLIESFGIDTGNQRISIEQYNKELDEAEAEFERGEVFSHEEVIAMTKKWIHGK